MRAKISWKPRHTFLAIIFLAVLIYFLYPKSITTQKSPEELSPPDTTQQNENIQQGYDLAHFKRQFRKHFAAHCSDPYPVKKINFKDEQIYFEVLIEHSIKEFELIGSKLPEDEDLREKALNFLQEYLKDKLVYLEAETPQGVRAPDDPNTNKRHIFVENPENNYDDRYEWRIHLAMLLISQGYVYLSSGDEVKKSVYSFNFYYYERIGKDSKQGVYAISEIEAE